MLTVHVKLREARSLSQILVSSSGAVVRRLWLLLNTLGRQRSIFLTEHMVFGPFFAFGKVLGLPTFTCVPLSKLSQKVDRESKKTV